MNHSGRRPRAVALAYDGVSAPRVIAQADGELRDAMLTLAQAHGVPIHRDPHLARLLSQVQLDSEIPLPLFVAVAEVLAFAYRLRGVTPPHQATSAGSAGARPDSAQAGDSGAMPPAGP